MAGALIEKQFGLKRQHGHWKIQRDLLGAAIFQGAFVHKKPEAEIQYMQQLKAGLF